MLGSSMSFMSSGNRLAVPLFLTKSVKFGRELVLPTFEGGCGCEGVEYVFHASCELFGHPNIPYEKRWLSGVNLVVPTFEGGWGV